MKSYPKVFIINKCFIKYNQKLHAHIDCQFWISLHGDKRRELFGQHEQDIA